MPYHLAKPHYACWWDTSPPYASTHAIPGSFADASARCADDVVSGTTLLQGLPQLRTIAGTGFEPALPGYDPGELPIALSRDKEPCQPTMAGWQGVWEAVYLHHNDPVGLLAPILN